MRHDTQYSEHDEVLMTPWEHIAALRKTVFQMVGVLMVAIGFVHYFHVPIIEFLLKPLGEGAPHLQFLNPLDPLYFILKVDLILGILLSLPGLFLLLMRYFTPALQLRWSTIFFFITATSSLSLAAAAYAYMVVVPTIISFMQGIIIPGTAAAFTAHGYLNFFLSTTAILILVFQIPIIFTALSKLGVCDASRLRHHRATLYLSVLVGIAIITPTTDAISLLLMTIPCIAAVELGIVGAAYISRTRTI